MQHRETGRRKIEEKLGDLEKWNVQLQNMTYMSYGRKKRKEIGWNNNLSDSAMVSMFVSPKNLYVELILNVMVLSEAFESKRLHLE